MAQEGIADSLARLGKAVAIPGNGCPGEVERIALAVHHHFYRVGVKRLFRAVDRHGQRSHPHLALGQILCDLANNRRRDHRLVALNVHNDRIIAKAALLYHLCQPLGAGLVIGTGHAHFAPGRLNRLGYVWVIGRHDNSRCAGLACPLQDVHDHWLAVDIHQRLTRQAG